MLCSVGRVPIVDLGPELLQTVVSIVKETENVSRSVMSDSAIPWTIAHLAPLSMGFSRQEYWSELPFPSPGDLPDQGIEPGSPYCRQILYCLSHQGSPKETA